MSQAQIFWEETYRRNINKLIGVCYRYVYDRQLAEDLAHDALLSAMQKAETFRGRGHFDAWLRKIAVNTALKHLRNQKMADAKLHELSSSFCCTNNDDEMEWWRNLTTFELLEAVEQLPEHHRLVFNMYAIDGFSHKDIAQQLGISEGTSKSHLARARRGLRQILSQEVQRKQRRGVAVFLLLALGARYVDRLYRSVFRGFAIQVQSASLLSSANWAAAPLPKFTPPISPFALVTVGVGAASVAVLVVAVMHGGSSSHAPMGAQPVLMPDTINVVNCTADTVPVSISADTVQQREEIIPKPQPVVVNRKRIVKKELVVRDTVTIVRTGNAE